MRNKNGYYHPSTFSLLHHYLPPYSSHRLSFMSYIFGIVWKRTKQLRQRVTWNLVQIIQPFWYFLPLHAHECNWQIGFFLSLCEGQCIPSISIILSNPFIGSSDISVTPLNFLLLCVCSDVLLLVLLTLETDGISSRRIQIILGQCALRSIHASVIW